MRLSTILIRSIGNKAEIFDNENLFRRYSSQGEWDRNKLAYLRNYLQLVESKPFSRFKPNAHWAAKYKALADEKPVCSLYLRQKGDAEQSPDSINRSGSNPDEYLDALRLLSNEGYLIFLYGDYSREHILQNEQMDNVVDFRRANMSEQEFSIFAQLNCDLFIGEAGGGFWLPSINGTKSLMLNAFPYNSARVNTTLYFKSFVDHNGNEMPVKDVFENHLYDHAIDGFEVQSMTSNEIVEAVREFLLDNCDTKLESISRSVLSFSDKHSVNNINSAKISSVWLTRKISKGSLTIEAEPLYVEERK